MSIPPRQAGSGQALPLGCARRADLPNPSFLAVHVADRAPTSLAKNCGTAAKLGLRADGTLVTTSERRLSLGRLAWLFCWWAVAGSNRGPPACKAGALTN